LFFETLAESFLLPTEILEERRRAPAAKRATDMLAIKVLLLTGFLLIGSWANNGIATVPVKEGTPFGLRMGLTLAEIGGNPKQVAPGKYQLTSVPKPHSVFEGYVVEVGPQAGLCWVKGIGNDVRTSVYGIELKHEFDQMKERLQQIYGEPHAYDFLLPGSIWDEPKDWMMALLRQERLLAAIWDDKSKTPLPSNIQWVFLSADAVVTDRGFIVVEYAFTNLSTCEAEIKQQEDRVL
jgi:hypothetical protein